jgi:hypothetical protein
MNVRSALGVLRLANRRGLRPHATGGGQLQLASPRVIEQAAPGENDY